MMRIFGVHDDLVHDPASGLTHRAPSPPGSVGRVRLDDAVVAGWAVVTPDDLHRTTPASACWSPIVRCNLHCPQCLDDTSVSELGADQRRSIAAILSTANLLAVDISGGEPLLLSELPDLATTIAAGGRAVSVTTNGWHLTRRTPELAGAVDAIRVSLDGPDPARHDTIRGEGSFERAADGIRTVLEAGIPTQIQTVLMRSTARDLQEMVDLAYALGVHGLTVLQMLPIGAGTSLPDELLPDSDAAGLMRQLDIPAELQVRLRTRDAAGSFTVVRADGRIWRNSIDALHIAGRHPLRSVDDLVLTGRDGTA
jgi:MoaA/NifB/PqqE/SkfB family radical SAM enzyme